jgi:hypothetical protein
MSEWFINFIQSILFSIFGGLIYGFVFWFSREQTLNFLIIIISRTLILGLLIFYLLNLEEHVFILIALLLFLVTFWLTIFKLERFY